MSEQPETPDRTPDSGPEVVGRPRPSSPPPTTLEGTDLPDTESARQAADTVRSISRLEEAN